MDRMANGSVIASDLLLLGEDYGARRNLTFQRGNDESQTIIQYDYSQYNDRE